MATPIDSLEFPLTQGFSSSQRCPHTSSCLSQYTFPLFSSNLIHPHALSNLVPSIHQPIMSYIFPFLIENQESSLGFSLLLPFFGLCFGARLSCTLRVIPTFPLQYGRRGGKIGRARSVRDSTGKPTESTNLGPQSLRENGMPTRDHAWEGPRLSAHM